MCDMLKKFSVFFDIRLSQVIPDRIDSSSTSITSVLVRSIAVLVISFNVPKVDTVLVSNSGMKVLM